MNARTLCAGVLLLISTQPVGATPDPGNWRRETLVAVNADSYFVWVSRWWQRGLHHEYHEAAWLERRLFAGNVVAEADTFYSASASNIDAPYTWEIRHGEHEPLDLSRTLRERKASMVFAGARFCDCVVRDGAVVLTAGDSTATVLSAERLALQVPRLGADPTVADCWYVSNARCAAPGEFWFYAIRSNAPFWDDDWSDILVVVPGEDVRAAAAQLHRQE